MVEVAEARLVGAALKLEIEMADWDTQIADDIADARMAAVAACSWHIGIADERGES